MNSYNPPTPRISHGPYIICIGRQLGSGGREIGKILSERLGIAYYDSEVLSLAAQHSGMSRDVFAATDEHRGFLRSVLGTFTPVMGHNDFYGNQMSAGNLFTIQSAAIRKAANEHSCIIIGRAADYVLRAHPRCISVFISANRQDRIHRIIESEHVGLHAAQRMLDAGDRQRADYYNFYAQGTWGAADTYNLLVNSSTLGIQQTVDVILDFAVRALKITLPETNTSQL